MLFLSLINTIMNVGFRWNYEVFSRPISNQFIFGHEWFFSLFYINLSKHRWSESLTNSRRERWIVLDLAYNRRETRDKRPLGRDTDRSWYHRHTNVKLFWSLSMAPVSARVSTQRPLVPSFTQARPRSFHLSLVLFWSENFFSPVWQGENIWVGVIMTLSRAHQLE